MVIGEKENGGWGCVVQMKYWFDISQGVSGDPNYWKEEDWDSRYVIIGR